MALYAVSNANLILLNFSLRGFTVHRVRSSRGMLCLCLNAVFFNYFFCYCFFLKMSVNFCLAFKKL